MGEELIDLRHFPGSPSIRSILKERVGFVNEEHRPLLPSTVKGACNELFRHADKRRQEVARALNHERHIQTGCQPPHILGLAGPRCAVEAKPPRTGAFESLCDGVKISVGIDKRSAVHV